MNIVTFPKVGAFFNTPDWRFRLFNEPTRKLTKYFRSDDSIEGGYLGRFVKKSNPESYKNNLKLSSEGQQIFNALTDTEKNIFIRTQKQALKEQKVKKVTYYKDNALPKNNAKWRVKDLENIKDEYFQRLIKHYSQVAIDENMEFAIQMKHSELHETVFRYIGYHIYLKLTDKEIAKRFKLKNKQIEAIRMLFFDFSNKPNDYVANTTYLRQLVNNEIFTEVDFEFYKIIDELGEIGLKARTSIYSLDSVEKQIIKQYLSCSTFENLLNIKSSLRTFQHALNYNSVINSFNNTRIAEENIKLLNAREENIKASTEKIKVSTVSGSSGSVASDEQTLSIMATIYNNSFQNNAPPPLRTIKDIQLDEEK